MVFFEIPLIQTSLTFTLHMTFLFFFICCNNSIEEIVFFSKCVSISNSSLRKRWF